MIKVLKIIYYNTYVLLDVLFLDATTNGGNLNLGTSISFTTLSINLTYSTSSVKAVIPDNIINNIVKIVTISGVAASIA